MAKIEPTARHYFLELSVQYYVAGRFAALNRLRSIAPNLLHHAVELILKATLATTHSLVELKKYSHSLSSLWGDVVQRTPALRTPSRDTTIAALDKFEDLRYPDSRISQGASITVSIRSGENPVSTGSIPSSGPGYSFNLGDVDELWAALFASIPANPTALLQGLSEAAREALGAENQHSIAPHQI